MPDTARWRNIERKSANEPGLPFCAIERLPATRGARKTVRASLLGFTSATPFGVDVENVTVLNENAVNVRLPSVTVASAPGARAGCG